MPWSNWGLCHDHDLLKSRSSYSRSDNLWTTSETSDSSQISEEIDVPLIWNSNSSLWAWANAFDLFVGFSHHSSLCQLVLLSRVLLSYVRARLNMPDARCRSALVVNTYGDFVSRKKILTLESHVVRDYLFSFLLHNSLLHNSMCVPLLWWLRVTDECDSGSTIPCSCPKFLHYIWIRNGLQ